MPSEHQNSATVGASAALPWSLPRLKRIGISAFLAFHLVAIICWAIPLDTPLTVAFRNAVRPYFLWSGLFQAWNAFAPAPKALNSYLEAIVIYHDGRVLTWKFPRMEQLPLTQRYYRERYRKFIEYLKEDSSVALWPDAARYIARLNNDASNPPEIVMLIRHWTDIVPGSNASAERPHVQIFYEYKVKPEDLK
jgi:hypothetical protein